MLNITPQQSGKCSDQHMEDAVTGGPADATEWRHSRACNGGACVEVARNLPGIVAVRDSKNPNGGALTFSPAAWDEFLAGVREDEFSLS